MQVFLKNFASGLFPKRISIIFSITKLVIVSPGWTLAERNTSFLFELFEKSEISTISQLFMLSEKKKLIFFSKYNCFTCFLLLFGKAPFSLI